MTDKRWSRGRSLMVAVPVFLLVLFLLGSMSSWRKVGHVRKRWENEFGTTAEVLGRFPPREANRSALEIEKLLDSMGIQIVPRSRSGYETPLGEKYLAYKKIKKDLHGYVKKELERSERVLDPPPATVEAYLERHRSTLDAVRRILLEAESPRWESDASKVWGGPVPNLHGHTHAQRLLIAVALIQSRQGDDAEALRTLEASWNLNRFLREEPFPAGQYTGVSIARMQLGALRHLAEVPIEWRDRLFDHDYRDAFLTALWRHGWSWVQIDEQTSPWQQDSDRDPGFLVRAVEVTMSPYARYCMADASDEFLDHLKNFAALETLCDTDLASRNADLQISLPRWNLVGGLILPDMTREIHSLARFELDRELTARVIELRDGVRRTVSDSRDSEVCPGDRWIQIVDADGNVDLKLSREVAWPNQTGIVLPTHFSVAVPPGGAGPS